MVPAGIDDVSAAISIGFRALIPDNVSWPHTRRNTEMTSLPTDQRLRGTQIVAAKFHATKKSFALPAANLPPCCPGLLGKPKIHGRTLWMPRTTRRRAPRRHKKEMPPWLTAYGHGEKSG